MVRLMVDDQLELPFPPDTPALFAAAAARRAEWLAIADAAFDDERLTTAAEWLMVRFEIEHWYGVETLRIDALYCAFYGLR
jgi:hypothetical protein